MIGTMYVKYKPSDEELKIKAQESRREWYLKHNISADITYRTKDGGYGRHWSRKRWGLPDPEEIQAGWASARKHDREHIMARKACRIYYISNHLPYGYPYVIITIIDMYY
jgi:hypothetical protein